MISVKKIIVFFLLIVGFIMKTEAQNLKNYESDWKNVEKNIEKGLPTTALEIVKQIYTKARADKQDAQLVKALVYSNYLRHADRVEIGGANIEELKAELVGSKQPLTSLLNSYLADSYLQFYQRNRRIFLKRTNTKGFNKDSIATWTADDFHAKIGQLYLASIDNQSLLQNIKIESFGALITEGNTQVLRPTLYDLLANQALSYFKSTERDITKPAYAFQIDGAGAFAPASEFVKVQFTSKDSLSLHQKALLVYQDLIRFHLNDKVPDALIDADIARLKFVHSNSVHPLKDQLFYDALEKISHKYSGNAIADQAAFLMAQMRYHQGLKYSAYTDTTPRYDLVKAKKIIDKILNNNNKTEGWTHAYNLNAQLIRPNFGFEVEKVNLPDQPFRMLVEYKNLDKIYLRIIPATDSLKTAVQDLRSENNYWKMLAAASPYRSWEQPLPENTDFQNHRVEIKINELPAGEYFILASAKKSFTRDENVLALRLCYISNISLVNSKNNFFVLHRNSGQPLAQAKVQVWQREYDYKTYKYYRSKFSSHTSDKNGQFVMNELKDNERRIHQGFLYEIDYGKEKFFMDDDEYNYYYYNSNDDEVGTKTTDKIFLFTDRSLYRPGQTIFFKGIVLNQENDGKKASVMEGYSTHVELYDANRQKVDSLKVITNEFGSFHGKFTLPIGGLNGEFELRTKDYTGRVDFRVEEYKRPKFYVDFEKVKGTYKFNEDVSVPGVAKAYAGNSISGARVRYRVVREPRFPYPWLFWRGWWPSEEPQEIADGEVITDEDGRFKITFNALPDLKIDAKLEPVFNYRVYADVTDLSGEVRSGEASISVGYKALLLSVDLPEKLAADKMKQLSIRTENMAGNFEKASVTITISKLKTEQRLLRSRYWARPDQFAMTKAEYIQFFPNDIYDDENDPKSWPIEAMVLQQTIMTDSTGIAPLKETTFAPGMYVIETTATDKEGQKITDKQTVELYDAKQKNLGIPQYMNVKEPAPIEPGEKTMIQFGSAANKLFVVQCLNTPAARFNFLKIDNEIQSHEFGATEADRGGYGVGYMFVKNNRLFQSGLTVQVPWTNKELKIEYTTFRDKALPGAKENWTVKISGYKNEKLAAEMLAGMYDASLDQFYPHRWVEPSLWYRFHNSLQWSGNHNFESKQARVDQSNYTSSKTFSKIYRELIWTRSNQRRVIGSLAGGAPRRVVYSIDMASVKDRDFADPSVAVLEENATYADTLQSSSSKRKDEEQGGNQGSEETQVRKNFNETAFFFPDLKTDEDGNISFSFTLPEALTKWKFQALAHTKGLAFGYSSKEIVTQKELMVQPNAPRFVREGDHLEFNSKIVNLSTGEIAGVATLQLLNVATGEQVDGLFNNKAPQQNFKIAPGQSQSVKFSFDVPNPYHEALTWRLVAKANAKGNAAARSDGEENILPVLSNRILVTETMPLNMRGFGSKKFAFDKLLASGKSSTLAHNSLTVEYTSNPAWYAVQALPYMMEYPYDCAEQTWNRYFANTLATLITQSSPKIKKVFEKWHNEDATGLESNLEKNQELKAILLEETPWIVQAKSETQQKKNIALLFDLVRMSREMSSTYEKLKQMQSPNGGFVWFKGGPDDRFVTQYIITGIGHLNKLSGADSSTERLKDIVSAALPYLDYSIRKEYNNLKKSKVNLAKYTPSFYVIQYLYMRSFFKDSKLVPDVQNEVSYFTDRAKQTWVQQNKYMQAMIALFLHRNGDAATPKAILKSLKENSVTHEELGRYFLDGAPSWWWYEAPIERQALIIEAFEEVANDRQTADDLRTWLLKNKQTNNWESTKATAEAVYALLLRGSDWLETTPDVTIDLGGLKIESQLEKTEAATGYFKKVLPSEKIKSSMGAITVTVAGQEKAKAGSRPSWGGAYWQYFEDLDKITFASTPLKIQKKLFVETNSDRGPVLQPVNEGDKIKIGDKVKVRIELRVDRDMEYVHMKDMRASSFEPINVLSSYKWQGGLGYYETTKDASTHFFFSYLQKGTYVFEYGLFATVAGNFSNGITTIQCMYAPEFTSHSEGVRVTVE